MRQFLKFMFASMVGTFLIGFVLIMIFIGSLAALGSGFSMARQTHDGQGRIHPAPALGPSRSWTVVSKDQFMLDFGPFRDANKIGLNTLLGHLGPCPDR